MDDIQNADDAEPIPTECPYEKCVGEPGVGLGVTREHTDWSPGVRVGG